MAVNIALRRVRIELRDDVGAKCAGVEDPPAVQAETAPELNVVKGRGQVVRRLPGGSGKPARRQLSQRTVNTIIHPGDRVLGHRAEELHNAVLVIPCCAVELAVITGQAVVGIGGLIVLVRVAVEYDLAPAGDHVVNCCHNRGRFGEADFRRNAPAPNPEGVFEHWDHGHLERHAPGIEVVGHRLELGRIRGGMHILNADQRPATGSMVYPDYVVEQVAECQIAVLLRDVSKRRVGEVPQMPRAHHVRP